MNFGGLTGALGSAWDATSNFAGSAWDTMGDYANSTGRALGVTSMADDYAKRKLKGDYTLAPDDVKKHMQEGNTKSGFQYSSPNAKWLASEEAMEYANATHGDTMKAADRETALGKVMSDGGSQSGYQYSNMNKKWLEKNASNPDVLEKNEGALLDAMAEDYDSTKDYMSVNFKGKRTEEQQKLFDAESKRQGELTKIGKLAGTMLTSGNETSKLKPPPIISAPSVSGAGRLGTGATLDSILGKRF